jgi:NADH:ubiquinone oxidoreductase subunit 5 (subunit L)/multisubunit Na+/H+ antiporter MnhA subunit/multisubunit Na+/H+ antiporter MnhB subunit
MGLAIIVLVPFVMSTFLFAIGRRLRPATQGWTLAVVLAALFAVLLAQIPTIGGREALQASLPWVPDLGLSLSIYVDGLALLFALIVTGVGSVVALYAGYYFGESAQCSRFLGQLMAFTGAMLGVVMAGNLITLFIAWELTSIISFLLISFKGKDAEARAGASQALIVTGGGGLALLVGLLLIGAAAGSYELGTILSSGDLLREHPWYTAIAVLVMAGCFSKSAQWPLHFWLPQAMAAPTPASAFLHSATMVKAGVYLLARFYPVLGDMPLWTTVLPAVGLITMLVGAFWALWQRDLKGILAFTTISMLGAFVALIGLPNAIGLKAAVVGIVGHALYKGALFLVVGTVDHYAGTRNVNELGGLRRDMPGFTVVAAICGLSMAGVPPLLGFVGKELLIKAALDTPAYNLALAVVIASAVFTVAVALIVFWDVFMGRRPDKLPNEEHRDHDVHHLLGDDAYDASHGHVLPRGMVYGPAALAVLSLVLGLGVGPLLTTIVESATGRPTTLYLLPPGGIDTAFMLSMGALAAGTVIFLTRRAWLGLRWPVLLTGPQAYRAMIRGIEWSGDQLLRSQGGKIRYYLAVILIAVIALMAAGGLDALVSFGPAAPEFRDASDLLKAMLLILSLGATLASILFRRHLLAALALGVAGYSVGGVFLLEPAPDVAMVQFLVETLATVLIILILAKTSEPERRQAMAIVFGESRRGLWRDVAIASIIGVGVTLFAISAVTNRVGRDTVASWHLTNAQPETGANDVVAAILTDFRGTDTLIEITVFGMAAIGVLTLLTTPEPGRVMNLIIRRRRRNPQKLATQELKAVPPPKLATQELKAVPPPHVEHLPTTDAPTTRVARFSTPLTRTAATLLLPVALLIALAHVLFGSKAPGDGFTAGVVAGLGIALWFVVFGYEEACERLWWLKPRRFIGFGVALSVLNAVLPLLFRREFFAFTALDVSLPAGLKAASSLVFEVGIFLAVLGGASAIMQAIAHPKEVEPL